MPVATHSFDYLRGVTGDYLGFGWGESFEQAGWDARQQTAIESCVQSGVQTVYHTPALDKMGVPAEYNWSFLQPGASLALAADVSELPLPGDYGSIEGRIVFSKDGSADCWTMALTGRGTLDAEKARRPDDTGRPCVVCEEPLKLVNQPQRFKLLVWPPADAAYTLTFRYHLNPAALTESQPYPYGGAQHAETFKAAVIAAGELYLDNRRGPRWEYFADRLAASVAADRRNKPALLGYNRDLSDVTMRPGDRRRYLNEPAVTFGGVSY